MKLFCILKVIFLKIIKICLYSRLKVSLLEFNFIKKVIIIIFLCFIYIKIMYFVINLILKKYILIYVFREKKFGSYLMYFE